MKLDVWPYRLPLAVPYRWSHGVQTERAGLIVQAQIGGAQGLGEVAPPPDAPVNEVALAAELAAVLLRVFLSDFDGLAAVEAAFAHHPWRARLRCGVASALLSARAAEAGVSLVGWLGRPVHTRVAVNDLITEADPAACAARAREALSRGQATIKLKCTADRALDLARVAAVRAVDGALILRLDPNESWAPDWVLGHLEALAPYGIEYVEQPLPLAASLKDYEELRRQSPIPIALDHAVDGLEAAQAIVDAEAADVLILKPQRLGGPDRLLEVADFATKNGLRCTVTNSLETAVGLHVALHCAALLPASAAGLGTARYLARDVAPPPPIVAGGMEVPTGPGLGVALTAARGQG